MWVLYVSTIQIKGTADSHSVLTLTWETQATDSWPLTTSFELSVITSQWYFCLLDFARVSAAMSG
jgi:hypothetical protein